MADLDAIARRGADPTMLDDAQVRADAISARLKRYPQTALVAQAQRAPTVRAKIIILRELADNVGRAAKGSVPCKAGCAHCCKMPVLILPEEAAQIAKETGAKLAHPELTMEPNLQYDGVPCTFLKPDGGCAIYAYRPYACRIYYSVDRDNLLCEIVPGKKIRTPQMDTQAYNMAFVEAFNKSLITVGFADLRDFFPKGLGK